MWPFKKECNPLKMLRDDIYRITGHLNNCEFRVKNYTFNTYWSGLLQVPEDIYYNRDGEQRFRSAFGEMDGIKILNADNQAIEFFAENYKEILYSCSEAINALKKEEIKTKRLKENSLEKLRNKVCQKN